MATANPVLTPAWSLLVTAGREFLLSIPDEPVIELAIRDAETVPTVSGHVFKPGFVLTRTLSGPGYLYGRTQRDSVALALSAWAAP